MIVYKVYVEPIGDCVNGFNICFCIRNVSSPTAMKGGLIYVDGNILPGGKNALPL